MESQIEGSAPFTDPHLEGVTFSVLRADGPYSLVMTPKPTINLYFVKRGRVLFECSGPLAKRAILTPNSCVGLSGRIPHSLKNADVDENQLSPAIAAEVFGTPDRGESVEIVQALLPEESALYLLAFKEVAIISPDQAPEISETIRRAIEWAEFESRYFREDPSSVMVIRRLFEIIFLQFRRFRLPVNREVLLYMQAANADKGLLRVLLAMQEEPEKHWTLQSLADEAYMSRTLFAKRFRELTGKTPIQALQNLRLKRAADQLIHSPLLPIDQVATNWGYQATDVFIRAFTRQFGMTPGRWRRSVADK